MDGGSSRQTVQVFSFMKIPQHSSSVLTSGSTQGTIRRNSDSVDVSSVTVEVILEFAITEVPDLDSLVPSSGDNEWIFSVWGESDAANPVTVGTSSINGVFAFTKGVPQFDASITRTRNNLSVIRGESNTEDIVGVSSENFGGCSVCEVPKSQGFIPRAGESESSIGRQNNVLNEVRVTSESTFWGSSGISISGEIPRDNGFITGTRNEGFVITAGSNGGDPTIVTFENSTDCKL